MDDARTELDGLGLLDLRQFGELVAGEDQGRGIECFHGGGELEALCLGFKLLKVVVAVRLDLDVAYSWARKKADKIGKALESTAAKSYTKEPVDARLRHIHFAQNSLLH